MLSKKVSKPIKDVRPAEINGPAAKGGKNMPREARLTTDVLQAVEDNNFLEVKVAFESKLKRKEKNPFNLFCIGDGDNVLKKELECSILAATKLKDMKILKYMIRNGANINFTSEVATTVPPSVTSGLPKTSPLHMAVKCAHYDTVALLLDNNADVNIADYKRRTPLHVAALNADCTAVRMLLCRGANVQAADQQGQTALQIVTKMGHVELVRILLENNAQIFHETQKGPSPLHIAGIHGHVPIIDMFSRHVDVNIKLACEVVGEASVDTVKQKAVIHLAAERGYVEAVRFLLERFGASANVLDSDNQTALHCALLHKHDHRRMRPKHDYEMLVDLLIKNGVKVNQQNRKGETALHLAAKNSYHQVVDLLHLNNADPKIRNAKGQTPFDVTSEFDVPMKQIFARCAPLTSPYISLAALAGTPPMVQTTPTSQPQFQPQAAPTAPPQKGITIAPTSPSSPIMSMVNLSFVAPSQNSMNSFGAPNFITHRSKGKI